MKIRSKQKQEYLAPFWCI